MQDVVRQSGSFSEKFIVCRVAKVVEGRQVWRAVAMAKGAVDDRVNAMVYTIFTTIYPGTTPSYTHCMAMASPTDSVCVTKNLKFMVTM